MILNQHQTVGDYLNSQKVIFLSRDGGRLFSSLRVTPVRETILLYTRTINAVHSSFNSGHLACMLPLLSLLCGIYGTGYVKGPTCAAAASLKWPICSHHNLILVTTYVFLVRPWVCHYKNVHVRCVKEMFPYLCPPSFSCAIIHSVLMVWAMWKSCVHMLSCDIPPPQVAICYFSTSNLSQNTACGQGWVNRVFMF